jgi:hypothetical protein
MRKILILLLFCFTAPAIVFSQQSVRRLPSIINHPSLNVVAPYISADGNALLFLSDIGQDGSPVVSYTTREIDWSNPTELPKHINSKLNYLKGYALSADGKRIYFTSSKSPIIGGYDLFTAELKGTAWSNPENLGMPINSRAHEGSPSITPDGMVIYFMRCDKMDQQRAEGCRLMRAVKKPTGQWDEPTELPSYINTGNSQTPRILADKETLIFSSDRFPSSRGGMDLYMTRLSNGSWSQPLALDFTNTNGDDQFVSVSATGRYLLREAKNTRNKWELTEFLLPPDQRPKGLTKVEGRITAPDGKTVPAYIAVTDLSTRKRTHSARPLADGSFSFYLMEGSQYEVSVDPEHGEMMYFATLFDLTSEKISQKEKLDIVLKRPEQGDEIALDLVTFEPHSAELTHLAMEELKRLARMVAANPGTKLEIQVLMRGLRESEFRDDDLTEETFIEELRLAADSVGVEGDSTRSDLPIQRRVFHNDRTARQAQSILDFLRKEGINTSRLFTLVNAIESTDGTVTTKVVARIL